MACIVIDIIIENPIELEGVSSEVINAPIEINTPILLNPTESEIIEVDIEIEAPIELGAEQNGLAIGQKGEDGLSAYEIAVNDGFVGTETEWLEFLKGADGTDGIDGLTTSVNDIEQIGGNIDLTTDNIPDTATNRYTNDIDIARLENTSGTNTGDQDLSGYLTNIANQDLSTANNSISQFITAGDIPNTPDHNDLNGLNIGDYKHLTNEQLIVVNNTSNINTGDQDLSNLVPYTGATQSVDLGSFDLIANKFYGDGSNLTGIIPTGTEGQILVNNGTEYISKFAFNPYVNVLNYGGDNTGTSDNQVAITSALAHAISSNINVVYFPPGIYKVDSQVTIPAGDVTFIGGGYETSIIYTNQNVIKIFAADGLDNITFDSLQFKGSRTTVAYSLQYAIWFNSCENFVIKNCKFYQLKGTGFFDNGDHALGISSQINNCKFNENSYGLQLSYKAEYVNVIQNSYDDNLVAIEFRGGNVNISNNFIRNNSVGIRAYSGGNDSHSNITSNIINHNTQAIRTLDVELGLIIIGNQFFGTTLLFENTEGIDLSHNDIGTTDVQFKNSTNIKVCDNIIYSTNVTFTEVTTSYVQYVNNLKFSLGNFQPYEIIGATNVDTDELFNLKKKDGSKVVEVLTNGDITAVGHITGKKCGVFASLTAPATTTITTAGTYEYVRGTFTNAPIECFSLVTINTDEPAIQYDDTMTQYFEIDWHATVEANVNNTTATVSFKKNGIICDCSEMDCFCKYADEKAHVSGTAVVELATDDTIQIVVTADSNGDEITFDDFVVTITEFFD